MKTIHFQPTVGQTQARLIQNMKGSNGVEGVW